MTSRSGGTFYTGSRVIRGGSWNNNDAANLRAASRNNNTPANRNNNLGFRCARCARLLPARTGHPVVPGAPLSYDGRTNTNSAITRSRSARGIRGDVVPAAAPRMDGGHRSTPATV